MIAVSAGGGASKGAWEAGVISYLCADLEIDPDIWTGTSVGALNTLAALHIPLGQPRKLAEFMLEKWRSLQGNHDVYVWNPDLVKAVVEILGDGPKQSTRHSVMSTDPLFDFMRGIYDEDALLNSGRKGTVVAVSVESGEIVEWHEDDPEFMRGAYASSAMPLVFPPVYTAKGGWCIDGGVRDVRPIAQAIARGADVVYDLSTDTAQINTDTRPVWSILDLAMRTLGIALDEIAQTDKETICKDVGVELITIAPFKSLGDPLDFSPQHIEEMIERGRADAKAVLDGLD